MSDTLNPDNIKRALDTLNELEKFNPVAIVCNPIHADIMRRYYKERFIILSYPECPEDKIYMIPRENLGDWLRQ